MTTKTVFEGVPVRLGNAWGVEIRVPWGAAEPEPGDIVETVPRNGETFHQRVNRVVRRDRQTFTCSVKPVDERRQGNNGGSQRTGRNGQQQNNRRHQPRRHCDTCTCR